MPSPCAFVPFLLFTTPNSPPSHDSVITAEIESSPTISDQRLVKVFLEYPITKMATGINSGNRLTGKKNGRKSWAAVWALDWASHTLQGSRHQHHDLVLLDKIHRNSSDA